MAQITNLNVAPYYDDFDENDRFHKVLFRPGYSIQARELTTLQSILQNQIQNHGSHMFKEGTVIIPGQVSYVDSYFSVKLSPTFANEQIKLEQYFNQRVPVIGTGETTGIKAKVLGYENATTRSDPYLYGDIIQAGSDADSVRFQNGENLSFDIATQHTSSYSANVASLRTAVNTNPEISCVQRGSAVSVESGVYFVRGQFVRCNKQVIVLSSNSNKISARVGFLVLEKLETPENDVELTDNSTGSTNYAAKGAHRLKLKLKLHRLPLRAPAPNNFIELIQLRAGQVIKKAATTEYSVIGDEIARRTFDESGDYTTKPFTFKVQEHIDNDYKGRTYKGAYGVATGSNVVADDNILASVDYLNLQMSTGKAYIKGYEVEKISQTNVSFSKARSFNTINAGVSTFNVGNFINIKNLYGLPDIGSISGETEPYREIQLYTDFTGTRGDASATGGNANTTRGYQIGTARARTIEYKSGTQGSTEAIYKLFLFDVRMLTRLTLSTGNISAISPSLFANHANGGVQIKGVTSGATGYVYKGLHPFTTNDPQILLTNVVGTFSIGEKVTVSDSAETDDILEDSGNTDLTIEQNENFKFEEVRSVYMSDKDDDTGQNFSADAVLALVDDEGKILLDGTDSNALDEFDQMITDGESVVYETQRVAKLIEPEKNISIFKLPKTTIKTLLTATNNEASDTQFTVRRQFIGTTNSSGVVSFSATGSNETFVAFADRDFICTVLTAGGGTAVAGDVILLTDKVTGTSTSTLTITDSTLLGSAAKVKVIATILKTGVTSKSKTTNLCKQLKVITTDDDGAYGIRATDREISLGRADVYKLISVYDSEDTSTDATVPSMTLTSTTGTFLRGEKIVGASTGAQARIITATSPMSYSLEGNIGAIDFIAGEVITGTSSAATATVGVLTAGSKVITSSFTLDTGQRDNYYDIARITRKKGAPIPLGRVHVVYDYLSHGSGDVFTVDSYSPKNGQMEYDNIPIYTATKVDPDAPEPTGTLPLRDCFDFRPTVEDIAGTSTTESIVDQVTANSFNMHARQYDGVGAVVVDSPKPASSVIADFEFYIGYRAAVFLTRSGKFKFVYGVPAETPRPPKDINDALKLATVIVPPYTFSPLEVKVTRLKTQRFTMRDIGRLKDRVERLEDLTSLNLLERSAESFEIQDQNGLNRFKSGFVVDNFKGHRVGAALNPDYKCAVDIIEGELRPKCVMRSIDLIESVTTDEERLSAHYEKNGDLITLPFQEQTFIAQLGASRIENPQPYVYNSYVGIITLQPSGDDWFETEVAPTINNNAMGDYDTVLANNQNSLGTFWNAWEIVSQGVTTDNSQAWETSYQSDGYTESLVQTSVDTTTINKKRTGVTTTLVEDIVFTNNTSISTQIIPYARSKKIKFIGQMFMPGKRVYPFFDGVDVSAFCEPLNSDYTNQEIGSSTDLTGFNLVTNVVGKIEGFFTIPEHQFAGQGNIPKFETQKELEFRLTSSPTNKKVGFGGVLVANQTAGQTTYSAIGVLETTQDTITGTKNGKIVQTSESQTTAVQETGSAYHTTLEQHFTQIVPPPDDNPSPQPPQIYQQDPPKGTSSCPSPETIISLTEDNTKQAGDLEVGDIVYTQHEDTLEWGDYAVTYVEIIPNSERILMKFDHTDFICSLSHKFYVENNGWTEVQDMKVNDVVSGHTLLSIEEHKMGDVVKITVDNAHTYISAGLLSHNKSPKPKPPPSSDHGSDYSITGDPPPDWNIPATIPQEYINDGSDYTHVPTEGHTEYEIASGSGTSPDAAGETDSGSDKDDGNDTYFGNISNDPYAGSDGPGGVFNNTPTKGPATTSGGGTASIGYGAGQVDPGLASAAGLTDSGPPLGQSPGAMGGAVEETVSYTAVTPTGDTYTASVPASQDQSENKIICTEMYRQTELDDWKTAMKIWGFHTKSHLTKFHQKGYHFIFMPWVKGMRKSTSLTKSGGWLAQRRTQHLKYILSRDVYNKYSKDTLFSTLGIKPKEKDDIIGRLWCTVWHPITFATGKILSYFEKKENK